MFRKLYHYKVACIREEILILDWCLTERGYIFSHVLQNSSFGMRYAKNGFYNLKLLIMVGYVSHERDTFFKVLCDSFDVNVEIGNSNGLCRLCGLVIIVLGYKS
jgi:hypothetical protein